MLPWQHKLNPTATTTCPCFTMAKALWGGSSLLALGTLGTRLKMCTHVL